MKGKGKKKGRENDGVGSLGGCVVASLSICI